MLNLWISSNISDTEEPQDDRSTVSENVSCLSPIPVEDWESELLESVSQSSQSDLQQYPTASVGSANFRDFAGVEFHTPHSDDLAEAPVVSTEGGSSEFPAPESMPSARFFYSNPTPTAINRHNSGTNIQDHNSHASHSRHGRGRPPQIHVQVNLPGSGNSNASAMQHQHSNCAHPHDLSRTASAGMGMAYGGQHMNAPTGGQYHNHAASTHSHQQQSADVPMLFHGNSYADNSMVNPSGKTSGNAAEAGDKDNFYSAFQPEVDFLEFQSMHFHLCKFYHKYGHANCPKHGEHFVLGSWVERLRQRKHIQDLQESGISVAASLDPISKRQTHLLETLGFRWHISSNENAMIIQHLNFVDNAHQKSQNQQVQDHFLPSDKMNGRSNPITIEGAAQSLTKVTGTFANSLKESSQIHGQSQSKVGQPISAARPGLVTSNSLPDSNASSAMIFNQHQQQLQMSVQQEELQQKHSKEDNTSTKPKQERPKKKRKKTEIEPANISQARMQQQAENIRACEGIIAKHNDTTTAEEADDAEKPTQELQTPKILIDPNLDTAEHLWKCQFAKLSEYKRVHGDCTVPARYAEDPKLGHWVMTQRRQFNLMKKGKPSSMTVDRIKLLNDVGFSWSIRIDPEKMWNLRYEQLQHYQQENGDCLVPQRFPGNPKLGTWVNTQRRHYKLMNEGRPSCMNAERVKMLKKIDFVWSTSTSAVNIAPGKNGKEKARTKGVVCDDSECELSEPMEASVKKKSSEESAIEGLSSLSAAANVIAGMHNDAKFYDADKKKGDGK